MSKGTISTLDFVIGVLREHEKVLLEGISGAKHAVVPKSGHLPQLDNPEGFLQEVKQFLSSIGS